MLEDLKCMDPEGIVHRPDQLLGPAEVQIISKQIAQVLDKHYPGWNWGITVDPRGGVVHIFALLLSGDMGYTLLLDDCRGDGAKKRFLLAGGEILERFGCKPRGFDYQQWRAIRRSPNGVPIPDLSDKHQKMRRRLIRRRALHATG